MKSLAGFVACLLILSAISFAVGLFEARPASVSGVEKHACWEEGRVFGRTQSDAYAAALAQQQVPKEDDAAIARGPSDHCR